MTLYNRDTLALKRWKVMMVTKREWYDIDNTGENNGELDAGVKSGENKMKTRTRTSVFYV